jgi:hypothetical protein
VLEDLRQRFGLVGGVVVPNGVGPAPSTPASGVLPDSVDLGRRRVVLGVGRLETTKGFDLLVDAIIPTDERSPGAREARVTDYIDLLLSEADAELRQQWVDGLAAVDAEASAKAGAPVAKLTAAQVESLLTALSVNERQPQTAAERFFVMTKRATIQGYYSSEIGIHKDLRYKGNQVLPEFHGCLTVDGKDCPHCGQKA